MKKEDYYVTLGVTKSASDEELKRAYRKLAIQYHPDRNPDDKVAEEKFKAINEAYQILSEPRKRAAYDQFGHAGVGMGGGFEQGFGGAGFSDIFDNIFSDIFGAAAGGGAAGGVDLRYNLEIEFEEAAFGTEKQISFEKEATCDTCRGTGAKAGTQPQACKTCRGTGQVRFNQGFFTLSRPCPNCAGRGAIIEDKCTDCRGRGKTRKAHTVSVKIPAGIDTDQRLRLRTEGEISEPGGQPGDLYVHIHVKEHALFKREGEHVILELPVTFVQAALGADIEVPTLGGTTQVKIPAGTQSGTFIRLKGKGIKRVNGSGFGEQIVHVVVETPKSLNNRQKDLLRQFDKESSQETQPGVLSFVQKFKEIFRA